MTRFQENAITWIAKRIKAWFERKKGPINIDRANRVIKVIEKVLAVIKKAVKEA